MITLQPLNDDRRLIEALHVPVAIVHASKSAETLVGAELVYYAVSLGFHWLYGPMFETLMGFEASGPVEWRGVGHTDVFPTLRDPDHEWSGQLAGALAGVCSGWNDTAWNAEEKMVTVAYHLTPIAPGWAAVEAVNLEKHAKRILAGLPHE